MVLFLAFSVTLEIRIANHTRFHKFYNVDALAITKIYGHDLCYLQCLMNFLWLIWNLYDPHAIHWCFVSGLMYFTWASSQLKIMFASSSEFGCKVKQYVFPHLFSFLVLFRCSISKTNSKKFFSDYHTNQFIIFEKDI